MSRLKKGLKRELLLSLKRLWPPVERASIAIVARLRMLTSQSARSSVMRSNCPEHGSGKRPGCRVRLV